MADMTDYLEGKLSNFLLKANTESFASPSTLYLALFTVDPGEAGAMTNEVSDSGTAYAREAITFGADNGTDGISLTDADITFTQATSGWGTVSHFGICDSNSYKAGNMLFYSPLNTSKTIDTDDIFKVSTGNISVTLA